jgi:predicted ATPase
VELAAVSEAAAVPQAVASALGLHEAPGRPLLSQLIDALRERQLLLVWDNCEHLALACAELADHLLRACAGLQIVATSREALRIGGERLYLVEPLELPPSPAVSPAELGSFATIRQYGRQKLQAAGEATALERRHAEWYLALAERAEEEVRGPKQATWLSELDWEYDNLRAAFEWSLANDGEMALRLAAGLCFFFVLRGRLGEARRWLEAALAVEKRPAEGMAARAKALHRELGNRPGIMSVLPGLGYASRYQRQGQEAVAFFDECMGCAAKRPMNRGWRLVGRGWRGWP